MQKLLKYLEENRTPYTANIPRESGIFLNSLVKKYKPKSILEIETSNGYSTLWLAKDTKAKVTTIEIDPEKVKLAKQNFKKAKLKNIKIIQGDVIKQIPKLKSKFDFIFIDARKRDYINYIKLIKPKLNKNAIITADNIISHKNKIQEYIKYVKKHFKNKLINIGSGIMLSFSSL